MTSDNRKRFDVNELNQFTGTDHWYQHAFVRSITYTDGVKYLAERAGAYWLIDEIAFAQARQKVKAEEFQVWTLKVRQEPPTPPLPKPMAVLTMDDGNGNVKYSKNIEFTDFPSNEVKLYFCNNVIHLPSEY